MTTGLLVSPNFVRTFLISPNHRHRSQGPRKYQYFIQFYASHRESVQCIRSLSYVDYFDLLCAIPEVMLDTPSSISSNCLIIIVTLWLYVNSRSLSLHSMFCESNKSLPPSSISRNTVCINVNNVPN